MRTTTHPARAGAAARHRFVCAMAVAASLLGSACEKKQAAVAPPPPEVVVAEVVRRDVPVVMELVGQTKGFQDVEIRARVEGLPRRRRLSPKARSSEKGRSSTASIRSRFEATLANAEADLATWQARLVKTENDVKRLHAAGREAGGQPAGARQRGRRRGRRARAGRRAARPQSTGPGSTSATRR